MTKVAIIGSGGHTRSSINLLLNYYNISEIQIYDNSFLSSKNEAIQSVPVVGQINDIRSDQEIFLSIGDNNDRNKYFVEFKDKIIKKTLFHRLALCEKNVLFGIANQVFANSYINSDVTIGDNNIINSGAIIEHEVTLGNHNHIAIGTKISGRCNIGNNCFIGAGSIIRDKLSICDEVIIGAGSIVVKDINHSGTYVGNPAKKIK